MLNRSPLLRSLRLLALLIQIALPSLGVVADARLELASVGQQTHVESERHECDARGHPPDCAICHYLRGGIAAAGTRPIVPIPSGIADRPSTDAAAPHVGPRLLLPARAPPRFS